MRNAAIVPKQGAVLIEYDPWLAFKQNEGRYRTVEQPYMALLELCRALSSLAERAVWPTFATWQPGVEASDHGETEADRTILDWCAENGALGIFSVRATSATLAATADYDASTVEQTVFRRLLGMWVARPFRTVTFPSSSLKQQLGARPGPHIEWSAWTFGETESKAPTEFIDYFPSLDPKMIGVALPIPNSPEFWSIYVEPVRAVWEVCIDFAAAVKCMCRPQADRSQEDYGQALTFLQGLAQATGEVFYPDRGGRLVRERQSAGLIASYALMFLLDVWSGRRVIECERCGRLFVSDEFRAKYCSTKCRNTASSQRYRIAKRGKS